VHGGGGEEEAEEAEVCVRASRYLELFWYRSLAPFVSFRVHRHSIYFVYQVSASFCPVAHGSAALHASLPTHAWRRRSGRRTKAPPLLRSIIAEVWH
jgi:hypothetical protein